MTKHEPEFCRNCRFWRPPWKLRHKSSRLSSAFSGIHDKRGPDGQIRAQEKGLCCRYAPQASALTSVWMETKAIDWCGDYERETEDSAQKEIAE